MRVRHVLTYLSRSGAYGGPASVARGQCAELAKSGVTVDLLAGSDGSFSRTRRTRNTYSETPVRSVKVGRSFAGVITPGLLVRVLAGLRNVDLHHIHLSRDLTSLPAAFALAVLRRVYVVQPHGMVVATDRLPFRLLDRLATRFVLSNASAVLALNDVEANELSKLGARASRTHVLPNGVTLPGTAAPADRPMEVLFIGRLHARKRARFLVEAAKLSRDAADPIDRFTLVGPDEGELPYLRTYIEEHNLDDYVFYEGAMTNTEAVERMREAAVVAMPSADEPFGLVALEALAQGTPVVVDRTSGVLEFLEPSPSVVTTDGGDPESIRRSILECITDYEHRQQAAQPAVRASGLDIESVVARLRDIYVDTLASGGKRLSPAETGKR